jgi:hypothetical protein
LLQHKQLLSQLILEVLVHSSKHDVNQLHVEVDDLIVEPVQTDEHAEVFSCYVYLELADQYLE